MLREPKIAALSMYIYDRQFEIVPGFVPQSPIPDMQWE